MQRGCGIGQPVGDSGFLPEPLFMDCLRNPATSFWFNVRPSILKILCFARSNACYIDAAFKLVVAALVSAAGYWLLRYVRARERRERTLLNWIYGCVGVCLGTTLAVLIMTCNAFSLVALKSSGSKLTASYSYILIGLSTLMALRNSLQAGPSIASSNGPIMVPEDQPGLKGEWIYKVPQQQCQ